MSAPSIVSSEPGRLLVMVVLLLALVSTAGAGMVLVRPGVSVATVAVGRVTDEVRPAAPADLARVEGIHLYLLPHPDDELSAWTSLTDDTGLYPVMVLLTQGTATRRCGPVAFSRAFQPESGEVPPQPRPDETGGAQSCAEARLSSFRALLSEAEESSPAVAGLGDADLEPLPGVADAQYASLDHVALVVLDLPDGELTQSDVSLAVDEVLSRLGHELPDLPLARVTASAYFADPDHDHRCGPSALCPSGEGPFPYTNGDHLAVREAARDLHSSASEGSWLVTTAYDPAASVFRALPQDLYDEFMALGPEGERLGSYQRLYGWLAFPNAAWRPGDLPLEAGEVMFSRVQAFEVVTP